MMVKLMEASALLWVSKSGNVAIGLRGLQLQSQGHRASILNIPHAVPSGQVSTLDVTLSLTGE